MLSFNQRLVRAKENGELSVSDLHRWFGICRETVSKWVKGVEPNPYKLPRLEAGLEKLNTAIEKGLFPMPMDITQYERAKYVEAVRDGKSLRVFKSRTPIGRSKVHRIFSGGDEA